jgi:hypothetical protein
MNLKLEYYFLNREHFLTKTKHGSLSLEHCLCLIKENIILLYRLMFFNKILSKYIYVKSYFEGFIVRNGI